MLEKVDGGCGSSCKFNSAQFFASDHVPLRLFPFRQHVVAGPKQVRRRRRPGAAPDIRLSSNAVQNMGKTHRIRPQKRSSCPRSILVSYSFFLDTVTFINLGLAQGRKTFLFHASKNTKRASRYQLACQHLAQKARLFWATFPECLLHMNSTNFLLMVS